MTDLKLLARRAMGMALCLVLFPALYEPVFGQVKTTVPDPSSEHGRRGWNGS